MASTDFTVISVYAMEALTLAWIGIRWRISALQTAAPVVLYWALFVLLATAGALSAADPEHFRLIVNPRAGAFLSLIAATAALILLSGTPDERSSRFRTILHGTWIALVFALVTAEISDYFRSLLAGADEAEFAVLRFHRSLTLVAAWTGFALPLTWVGLTLRLKQLLYAGIGIVCFAVLVGTAVGAQFVPIELFRPVLNIRFLTLGFLAGTGLWQAIWVRKNASRGVGEWIHLPWMIMCFILCTAETADSFRQLMPGVVESVRDEYRFMRLMVLAGVWVLISVPMVWRGALAGNRTVFLGGLLIAVLGACTATVRGIAYDPVTAVQPLLNVRAGILLLTIGILLWYVPFLLHRSPLSSWRPELSLAMRLLAIVAMLALLTGEIRDSYERQIAMLPADGGEMANQLENMKQMILSSAWLVYSILLMGYGIWRRTRVIRISSIVIFGFAILKIFIYDLSFLDTLYRIFSFMGLGVILLAVSYLYQRFRETIFDSA